MSEADTASDVETAVPYTDRDWLYLHYCARGERPDEIASLVPDDDVTEVTILRHITDHQLHITHPGSNSVDEDYADEAWLREQYHGEDKTAAEIAHDQGVSPSTILRWLREHDIERRPPGGPFPSDSPRLPDECGTSADAAEADDD